MSSMRKPVAVITGGSSGIGASTARFLAEKGCKVYELSRRESSAEGITHISADVTDEAAITAAIGEIVSHEERIDILINCAGFGISGAIEFTELSDAKRQLDVNFFGMVNVTRAVIPLMRKARRGRIVNISSVAAPVPIPFQAYYSCSKAAINSYSCALANELRPFGVSVCAVQPGDIASGFTGARKKTLTGDEVYGGRISRSVETMEKDERGGMSPDTAGAYIAKIALKPRIKPLYAIGLKYKFFCFLCKILPCGIQNRIIGMLYAS